MFYMYDKFGFKDFLPDGLTIPTNDDGTIDLSSGHIKLMQQQSDDTFKDITNQDKVISECKIIKEKDPDDPEHWRQVVRCYLTTDFLKNSNNYNGKKLQL